MKVYLDNAATTRIEPRVLEAMEPYLYEQFGNPSSIHTQGRATRSAIERSRKKIADLLNTSPSEIFFTSGGTESDNTAIYRSIEKYDIKHVITTRIEHHAVLHPLEGLELMGKIQLHYAEVDEKGVLNLDHFSELSKKYPGSLVSLMHANNEIATLHDVHWIGEGCTEFEHIFHSDTVQTVAHFPINLQELNFDFIVGSAHKFHGPKGIGFLYIRNNNKINPLIQGGSQERNMRGGTENIYGIVGMAKALEIAMEGMDEDMGYIKGLKTYLIERLKEAVPDIRFNGQSDQIDDSLYTVLNASLPPFDGGDLLLFNLDIHGISASGGSACASGSNVGSHVLEALNHDPERTAIRFSLSKYNTKEELDYTVSKLSELVNTND